MAEEGLNELKEKRLNLLVSLGEEAHSLLRSEKQEVSDKMKNISEEIKKVDVQINQITNPMDDSSCPQCHAKLEQGTMFCKECGFAVQQYFAAYVTKCSCCGVPMKAEQKFCIACGTKNKNQQLLEKVAE